MQTLRLGTHPDKRIELARDCITRLLKSDSAEELEQLFWVVAGFDEQALQVIVDAARTERPQYSCR